MRYGIIAILWVAVSAPLAWTQTFDLARFRQAIEMPAVSTQASVTFRANERDGKGNKIEPEKQIDELQKKLTGGPDDAEIFLEMRSHFLNVGDDEKADEKTKKRALFDAAQSLKCAEAALSAPTQDKLLRIRFTLYGRILEAKSDNPWSECERLARDAVKIAPDDWYSWAYLAHVRHQQIPAILCGGSVKDLPKERRTQEILGKLYMQRCEPRFVDEAEKTLNEVLQCHDKAKQLAPNDPKRQIARYGFRLTEVVLRNAIAGARDQKPPYPLQQVERVVLDELESAARLNPEHLLWQSQLVHQLVIRGWQQESEADKKSPVKDNKQLKTFRPARPEDAKAIQEALGRIEKLADSAQGETAVYCRQMLAALCASMQDNAGVEKHSRKVLSLDPKNQLGAEQLQQALHLLGRHADRLQAAQAAVQAYPSARNRYLLAKALCTNQQYDQAEKECRAVIKLDPWDVYCHLGLAALTMRRADDPKSLEFVRTCLDNARRDFRPETGPLAFNEIEYLTAVYHVLTGDAAIGRNKLRHMQGENPENGRYEKLLSAWK